MIKVKQMLYIAFIFLLITVLISFLLDSVNIITQTVTENDASISFKFLSPVNFKKIKEINTRIDREIKCQAITYWNNSTKNNVLNKYTNKSTTLDVVYFWGDSRPLVAKSFLSGAHILQNTQKGCILSSDAAFNLFGTADVVNLLISFHEEEYVILGVFDDSRSLVLIKENFRDTFTFEYTEVVPLFSKNYDKTLQWLQNNLRLAYVEDGRIIKETVSCFLYFPLLIVFIYISCVFTVNLNKRKLLKDKIVNSIWMIILLIMFTPIFARFIPLINKITPTKFSNLKHWDHLISFAGSTFMNYFAIEPTFKSINLNLNAILFLMCILIISLSLIQLIKFSIIRNVQPIFFLLLLAFGFTICCWSQLIFNYYCYLVVSFFIIKELC